METKTKSPQNPKQRSTSKNIVIHRVFEMPASKVWKAWTDPEDFKKWWGPKDFTCPYSTIEAREEGRYLNCMRGPDGKEYWSTGVVKELIPEKKLVITDNFADANGNVVSPASLGFPGNWPSELLITVELEEADGATKLKLVHEGIPDEMYDECMQGWNESLDKLEKSI